MKRTIIIGDIHGCYSELMTLLDELTVTDADQVVSVGDMVDRGPESEAVVEFFRTRPNASAIMGNHERKHVRGVLSASQEIVKRQFGPRYEGFRAWAETLPYYLDLPEALVVHGGFEPGVPLERQREEVLCCTMSGAKRLSKQLGEDRFWKHYAGPKPVVFGHHVVGDQPLVFERIAYGLDTGACHGGFLSALLLPGFELCSVPARKDYWREAQGVWRVRLQRERPWATYAFKKIDRELAELRASRHDDVRAFAAELATWQDAVLDLLPALIATVAERLVALRSQEPESALRRAIAREPSPPLLFASLAQTLDEASARAHLPTPAAVLDAASAYGVEGHALPAP